MYIHKEGYPTIAVIFIFCALVMGLVYYFSGLGLFFWSMLLLAICFFIFILSFFRNPKRTLDHTDPNTIICPADGKVVVIEETYEPEFLKEKCIQVSIFMSPLNVHVNRNPVSGTVKYEKYHKGKYLVAWHPKSSTDNERHTTVYASEKGTILMRQIAGALARRIVHYLDAGHEVTQGGTMGFIKFGSRVDLFLPLDSKIKVTKDQVVRGNVDVIAQFS